MRIGEITLQEAADFLRIEAEDIDNFETMLSAATAYIKSYTGLTTEELNQHEDITIAALVLIGEMHENRTLSVDTEKQNPFVMSILAMHSVNYV